MKLLDLYHSVSFEVYSIPKFYNFFSFSSTFLPTVRSNFFVKFVSVSILFSTTPVYNVRHTISTTVPHL